MITFFDKHSIQLHTQYGTTCIHRGTFEKEFFILIKRFELSKCISNLKDTDFITLQGTLYTQ